MKFMAKQCKTNTTGTGMKALKVIHVRLGQFLPCRTWSKRVKTVKHLAVDFHSFDPKRSPAMSDLRSMILMTPVLLVRHNGDANGE